MLRNERLIIGKKKGESGAAKLRSPAAKTAGALEEEGRPGRDGLQREILICFSVFSSIMDMLFCSV